MRRSHYRRQSKWPSWLSGRRRIVAAVATLVAFGAIVTVTQVSNASTEKTTQKALAACNDIQAPKASKLSSETKKGTYTTNNGKVTQHSDDGAGDVPSAAQMRTRCRDWVMQNQGGASPAPSASTNGQQGGGTATAPPPGAGLGILTNSCKTSTLPPHDGFQNGDRCVSTEFGEVGSAVNNPSLLITEAPRQVAANTPFTLKVSTRNLIRDRFLAAGQGGYYVESSVLQGGIVRGHFHTACRMLANTDEAPAPDPVPAFFVATEDKKGGAAPDVVTIQVAGLPTAGLAQCASWAGDGSHRIPMMQRANQTPAFDAVRINVTGGGDNGGGGNNGGNNNGGGNNGGGNNGGQQGGGQQGGGASTPPSTGATPTGATQTGATPTPTGSQPTTKGTVVKGTPSTAPTTKPATTTKSTTKPATTTAPATTTKSGTTANGKNTAADTTVPDQSTVVETETTKQAKATPSKSAAAAQDYSYSNDDSGAPDPNQDTTQVAEPVAAAAKSGSKLALTGYNSIALVGGGVLLVLLGLVTMSVTRRRRARAGWR
jgi:hypothetical protein